MARTTMYITIPKERAARILTDAENKYKVGEDGGDQIVIQKSVLGSPHRATLTDYELPQARISDGETSVEAGTVGTKVEYSKDRVRQHLEEYEV